MTNGYFESLVQQERRKNEERCITAAEEVERRRAIRTQRLSEQTAAIKIASTLALKLSEMEAPLDLQIYHTTFATKKKFLSSVYERHDKLVTQGWRIQLVTDNPRHDNETPLTYGILLDQSGDLQRFKSNFETDGSAEHKKYFTVYSLEALVDGSLQETQPYSREKFLEGTALHTALAQLAIRQDIV